MARSFAVIWAAVGGRLSLLGAILGAYLVNGLQSYMGDELQDVWMIVLGSIFIGVVLFLPRGLVGLIEDALGYLTGKSETETSTVAIERTV